MTASATITKIQETETEMQKQVEKSQKDIIEKTALLNQKKQEELGKVNETISDETNNILKQGKEKIEKLKKDAENKLKTELEIFEKISNDKKTKASKLILKNIGL